jgi:hypothetical protein
MYWQRNGHEVYICDGVDRRDEGNVQLRGSRVTII